MLIYRSLAYHEMRLTLAKVLWHFDLSLCAESADWTGQKVYMLWEKKSLMVRLAARVQSTEIGGLVIQGR